MLLAKKMAAPPLAAAFAAGQASSTKRGVGKVVEDAEDLAEHPRPKRQRAPCGPRPTVERAPAAPEQLTLPGDSQVAEQPADVRQATTEQLPGTRTLEEPSVDAGGAVVEEPAAHADASQAAAEPGAEIEAAELPGKPDQGPAADVGAAVFGGPPSTVLMEPHAGEEPGALKLCVLFLHCLVCSRPSDQWAFNSECSQPKAFSEAPSRHPGVSRLCSFGMAQTLFRRPSGPLSVRSLVQPSFSSPGEAAPSLRRDELGSLEEDRHEWRPERD